MPRRSEDIHQRTEGAPTNNPDRSGQPHRTKPQTVRPVLLAACCAMAMAVYAVYLGALGVLLPLLGAKYGLGTEVQGRLFPANFSGFVVGVLICGWLSDRHGRKAVMAGGAALYCAGLFLMATAPGFSGILLASALVGAGSGAMEVVASALAGDVYPQKRALLLNGIQVAFGIGAVAGPVVVRAAAASSVGWSGFLFGIAALTALLVVVLIPQGMPAASSEEGVHRDQLRGIVSDRAFRFLCIALCLYVGGEVAVFSWVPSYMTARFDNGSTWAATSGAWFWIGMTAGRFLVSALVHRFRSAPLAAGLAFTGATVATLITVAPNAFTLTLVTAACGFLFAGIFGLVLAEAADRFPNASGTVLGGVVASGGAGGAILPYIVSAVADSRLGWGPALALIPVAMGTCGVLLATLPKRSTPVSGA